MAFLGCFEVTTNHGDETVTPQQRSQGSWTESPKSWIDTVRSRCPPLLVRAANNGVASVFEFNLGNKPDDYFMDARTNIQGKAASYSESVFDLQVQGRYGSDPTQAAACKQQLAERQAAAADAAAKAQQESTAPAKTKYDAAMAAANAVLSGGARIQDIG